MSFTDFVSIVTVYSKIYNRVISNFPDACGLGMYMEGGVEEQ